VIYLEGVLHHEKFTLFFRSRNFFSPFLGLKMRYDFNNGKEKSGSIFPAFLTFQGPI